MQTCEKPAVSRVLKVVDPSNCRVERPQRSRHAFLAFAILSTPAPSVEHPPEPSWAHRVRHNLRRQVRRFVALHWFAARLIVALTALALTMSATAWAGLHLFIVPRINEWRSTIEDLATQAVGVTVRIARIEAHADGLLPRVALRDVQLIDAQGHPALTLPHIDARLSGWALTPAALLRQDLPLRYLVIRSPELEVRRDAQGRIFVAGLPVHTHSTAARPETDTPSAGANWLFSQNHVQIDNGRLRWIDEQRGTPALDLHAVSLTLRNGPGLLGRHHEMRISATPPAAWGQPFSMQAEFDQPLVDARALVGHVAAARLPRAALTHPADWRTWRGQIDVVLPHADVQALRRHVDLPIDIDRGQGDIQARIEWADRRLRSASATLHLREVQLRLGRDLDALALKRLDGRISARFDTATSSLRAEELSFVADAGWAWPQGDVALSWRTDPARSPDLAVPDLSGGGELNVRALDLNAVSHLLHHLPLGQAVHAPLRELAPQGQIETLSMRWDRWDRGAATPSRYSARGRVRGLTIEHAAAAPGTDASPPVGHPGVANLDLSFNATERGGQADVSVRKGSLSFPGVFDEPTLALRELDTRLRWTLTPAADPRVPPRIELQAQRGQLINDDLSGSFNATWRTGDPQRRDAPGAGAYLPGTLQLDALIEQGRAAAVPRYLPTTIPHDTRAYLIEAIQAGEVRNVNFKIDGDLWDVPFGPQTPGTFLIRGEVRNATLLYVPPRLLSPGAPGWPAFTQLDGELVFDRESMRIHRARGRLSGVGSGRYEIHNVEGRIDSLGHDATLVIEGQGKGTLADALRLVQNTPLDGWTGRVLTEAHGDGPTELQLGLTLPLSHINDSTVRGSLKLGGAEVRLIPEAPIMSNVRGKVDFTDRGVRLQTTATMLGGPLTFEGGSQSDGSMRFTGANTLTADGLRRYASGQAPSGSAPGSTPLERLTAALSGQTQARFNLTVARGQTDWQLTSALTGLSSALPAPFGKTADTPLPLKVSLHPIANANANTAANTAANTSAPASPPPQHDVLRLELGALLQAHYLRDISGPTARVLRGAIGVQQAARLPGPNASGIDAQITASVFDADAWQAVFKTPDAAPTREPQRLTTPLTDAASHPGTDNRYLPDALTLRAREIRFDERRFGAHTLTLIRPTASNPAWRARIDGEQAKGTMEWRPLPMARSGAPADNAPYRVQARMSKLVVPAQAASTSTSATQAPPPSTAPTPPSVPALDVAIDDLEWGGMKLGRFDVQADHSGAGDAAAARAWRLSKLNIGNPDARLSATGQWMPADGGAGHTTLDFKLDLSNAGNTLTRLGLPKTLRNGKGQLSGQLGWAGSPLSPNKASMDGQLKLGLEAGQFLRAEPGIAKLLGVLTLQSLPRRLLLDFRDVVQEGFAFDRIDGDASITRGVAHTRNLRTRGVQALVLMEGQADLVNETQNLHVWIVPEINAGTASLAYAAINPVVGLGTFVAQYLLRKPLAEASTRELRISGTWADPKVESIERTSAAPRVSDAPASGSPGAYISAPGAASAPAPAASSASAPATARP